jgi:uncharacterized membrane protein
MAVSEQLEQKLQQWVDAGALDPQAADRIRTFESTHDSHRMRWPVVLAITFGAIMVAAGVLLFVADHWDDLSPAQRFLLVLAMIAGFHLAAGALMPRLRPLGIALHGVGTAALGAGIFLAGQIFNLQEHWPGGVLLWAIGALLSWVMLRDWVQATLSALLIPAWIASEWTVRTEHFGDGERRLIQFLTLLAITYLGARRHESDSYFRRALGWVGGIALLPLCAIVAVGDYGWGWRTLPSQPLSFRIAGWLMAFGLPLVVAVILRGRGAVWNAGFALWILALSPLNRTDVFQNLGVYGLCALASVALVVWGLQEQRRERINLGVAGFAITIIAFYFSTFMDKLGRSASLVGFGLLFLLGGWKLEQLRRKLVARTAGGAS